jgi:hypothetical protein
MLTPIREDTFVFPPWKFVMEFYVVVTGTDVGNLIFASGIQERGQIVIWVFTRIERVYHAAHIRDPPIQRECSPEVERAPELVS